jgi:protease IV
MKRFVVGVLAGLGGLTLLLVGAGLVLAWMSAASQPGVPDAVVLELELTRTLEEDVAEDPLTGAFNGEALTVRDVVDALERAAGDARVKALVVRVADAPGSVAVVQEVRDAVKAFRARGKRAVAYTDTFGEGASGMGAYYLASAFDAVYVQPSGDVSITGIGTETPFLRDAFERFGVKPQMGKRYEYKAAVNSYTEQTYTAAHREEFERYFTSVLEQMAQGVAEGRGLGVEAVRAAIDEAPLSAERALELKLVDGLLYRDEVYARVKEAAGAGARLLFARKYLERAGRPHEEGPVVALIYGAGGISRGRSGPATPLADEGRLGADTVAAALRKAVEDPRVKAILLRVDSPGGSYVASDTMRREVQRAREQGKPVIVSMGTYAASGGYFLAMEADKIVAQPGTLTGSIGVYGGKMVTQGAWDKLGVSWEPLGAGRNATMYSTARDFTPEQLAKNEASLDRIYADFTTRAAAGRKLPVEQLREVARGRIWSGADARERGLVDELGGFAVALRLAREAAKLPDAVRVELFPRKKGTAEMVAELLGKDTGDNSDDVDARVLPLPTRLGAQARALRPLGVALGLVDERAGVLSAPVPDTRW